jgi:hypothetical protein
MLTKTLILSFASEGSEQTGAAFEKSMASKTAKQSPIRTRLFPVTSLSVHFAGGATQLH